MITFIGDGGIDGFTAVKQQAYPRAREGDLSPVPVPSTMPPPESIKLLVLSKKKCHRWEFLDECAEGALAKKVCSKNATASTKWAISTELLGVKELCVVVDVACDSVCA